MADFGLQHSLFLYINKTAVKKFGAIDKFLFENLFYNLVQCLCCLNTSFDLTSLLWTSCLLMS